MILWGLSTPSKLSDTRFPPKDLYRAVSADVAQKIVWPLICALFGSLVLLDPYFARMVIGAHWWDDLSSI